MMIGAALMTGVFLGSPALAIEIVAGQDVDPRFVREATAGVKAWQELIDGVFKLPDGTAGMRVHLFATSEQKLEAAQRVFGLPKEQVGRALGLSMFGKLPIGNADAGTNTILIRLDEPGFRTSSPGHSVAKIAGHELTHLWQQHMEKDSKTVGDPAWLIEGVAEYFGFRSAAAAGLLSESEINGYCRDGLHGREKESAAIRLEDMATQEGLGQANARVNGVVYCLLAQHFGALENRQPGGIRTYYQLRREGLDWERAFKKSFRTGPPELSHRGESIHWLGSAAPN